jgi:hypothetical protein
MATMYARQKYERFFHVLKCTIEDLDALSLDATTSKCTRVLQTLMARENDLNLHADDVRKILHDAMDAFS